MRSFYVILLCKCNFVFYYVALLNYFFVFLIFMNYYSVLGVWEIFVSLKYRYYMRFVSFCTINCFTVFFLTVTVDNTNSCIIQLFHCWSWRHSTLGSWAHNYDSSYLFCSLYQTPLKIWQPCLATHRHCWSVLNKNLAYANCLYA